MQSYDSQTEKNNSNPISGYLNVFLLASLSIWGFIAAFSVFKIPSMEKNAFLFGYSSGRILTGGSVLAAVLFFLAAGVYLRLKPESSRKLQSRVSEYLIPDTRRFLSVSLLLVGLPLVIYSGLLVLYFTPVNPVWPPLQVVVDRALAAIIWFSAVPLHLWGVLAVLWSRVEKKESLKDAGINRVLFVLTILVLTGIQWWTLLLRSNWIRQVGSWFRKYRFNGLQPSYALLVPLFLLSVLAVNWLVKSKARMQVKLVVVFVIGAVLLTGFAFAEGTGFDFFVKEYIISEFHHETLWACEYQGGILDAIRNYEEHFSDTLWYGTKPPGLLALYMMAREGISLVHPVVQTDKAACLWGITTALAYLAPILSFLSLVPLVLAAESLLGSGKGSGAGLLYVSIPSVLLMVLKPDQFIYPFFFAVPVFFLARMLETGKNRKTALASGFLAGSMMYIAIFVSFSLLPLLGLAAAWISLVFLSERGWEEIKPWLWKGAGFVLGFGILWALFDLLLNYDMIHRYQLAMENHIENKDFYFTIPKLLSYARLNNVEFAFWAGMPVYLLMIAGSLRSILALARRKAEKIDLFGAAFLFTYLALHVIGQTRGEVGRMWIFLLPAGVILAAREAYHPARKPAWGLMLVFILQLATADLMYLFMNWR